MLRIKNKEIKSPIVIAPMAGISNGAFRELCFEFGAGLVYTEMVSDKAIFYDNKKTMDMLVVDDNYHPISMQLFGSDKDSMVYAAKILDKKTNCDFIDINMGCPVHKVVKTGAGSAMMLEEDKAVDIVKAIIDNVDKPVTVKMRLGYTLKNMNYLSLAKKLESVGVSLIALHARTRGKMYDGHADWSHIKTLKENLSIPVIGNGDIDCYESAKHMMEYTGCDAVAIGRGAEGNPWIFRELIAGLNGEEYEKPSSSEVKEMIMRHARMIIDYKGEYIGVREMRKHAAWYTAGFKGASKLRGRLNEAESYESLYEIVMGADF